MTFVHLHNHSEFSPLDGLQRPVGMCREAKRQGAPAVAFTDHGTLAAAPAMAAAGLEVGIPVIGGVEAYVAVGSRWSPDTIEGVADSDAEGDRVVSRYHLTLLAKSQQGWNNLVRLTNEASQSVKSYPLMDFELLKQYSDGLIIGTGCLGGPLSVALRSRGGYQAGLEIVAQLLDILDGDTERLFVEVMDHGIPDERALLPMQVAIADHYGLRIVATNDAHYTHIDQCEDHDRWLAIGSSKHLDDPKRFRFHGAGYHMRTSEEILEAFSWAKEILGDRDIIGTSVEIANMVEGTLADFLPASRPRMPKFPVTNPVTLAYAERDGVSPQNRLLRELVGTGAVKRFCDPNDPHPTLPQVVKDRLKFEFDVISKFGYEDYFLIVNDWIAWARNEGYPAGPGRGCLHGDSLIWTTAGYLPIRDIQRGDTVRTHTGALRQVSNTFRYEVEEKLVTLRTFSDGNGVSMTSDHKVLVSPQRLFEGGGKRARNGRFYAEDLAPTQWTPAGEVQVGDLLCVPRPASPGTAPSVIDVASVLPAANGKTRHIITSEEIIELVPTNRPYPHSVREVTARTGVSRHTIQSIIARGWTETGPLTIQRSNGQSCRATRSEAARDALWSDLSSHGFASFAAWDAHVRQHATVEIRTPRFVTVDEDLLFLLGAFASNGWLRTDSTRAVGFAERGSIATDLIPLLVKRVWGLDVPQARHATTDLVQWDIRSAAVFGLFRSLAPDYRMSATTKHLPTWVADLSLEQKRMVLDGLWWGDGSRHDGRASYSTASSALMQQVRDLLWSIGAPAGVRVDDRIDLRPEFANRARSWQIRTTGGFTAPKDQFGGADENFVYLRVRSAETTDAVREVFDFEVPVDHSFMTDSYVVHNSAAGSLVAFCLQITDVDPLKHNLLFERFLDVTRLDPPDIDIDFPEALFNRAVGYLQDKYGYEHVAQIGTFSSKKAKSLVRDLGRLTGYASLGATLAEMVPDHADVTLTDLLRTDPDPENENQVRWSLDGAPLRAQMEEDDMSADLVEQAVAIEGTKSYPGIHACGVVLSDEPLLDILPMRKDKRTASTGEDGKPDLRTAQWVTIWDSNPLAAMGFTKFDRLGLKSLDIIAAAKEHVEKVTGEPIDLAYGKLPMDGQTDERARRTWELLAAGDTAGLFQLGSSGMTKLVKGIAPTCLDDLSVAVALYRPGPMGAGMHNRYVARRRGQEEISYEYLTSNPAEAAVLAGVLDKSLGLIVVQEDLMSLARDVAGFGPDKRNKLRKAFSKKKKADMDALKEIFFRQGAIATLDNPETDTAASIPFGEHTLKELWRTFEASASYLFNSCAVGETELWTGRGTGPKAEKWTIEKLYHRLYGDDDVAAGLCAHCGERPTRPTAVGRMCARCSTWLYKFNDSRGFMLLAYDSSDGRIRPQRVKDVHCHGVKPVFRIELSDGTVLRSTGNHRWLSTQGYRTVDQLNPGDALIADGGYERQDSSDPSRRVTVGERIGSRTEVNGVTRSGWFIDGGYNRLQEWTEQTIAEAACDECGVTREQTRLERAHLDGDRTNNQPSNLAWKCVSHHKEWDYAHNNRPRRWAKGHTTRELEIVTITPDGEELVYDVEMAEGTDHNFVADGVVSHNSHSAPYAYIGYMTAYLKANWPAHFAAAQLTVTTDKDRRLPVLDSVRRSGVTVLGPSLAAGNLDTAVESSHTVRLGLSEIAGVKDNAAKLVQIIERNGGPFKTLGDLLRAAKVDDKFIPSNVFEGLIDAGALDEYGTRRGMSCVLRALREYPDLPIPTIEWSVAERAARERARLGIIVGRHPLSEMQAQVRAWNPHPDQAPCVPVAGLSPCPVVTTKAMVSEWTIGHTRGREFARFTIEGSTGSISGVLWPESLEKARLANGLRDPKPGDIVCMRGRVKISAMGDVDEDDSTDEQLEMIGSAFWLGTHFVSVAQDNLAPVRALHVASMFSVPAMQPDVSSPQEPVDVVEVEDEADADAASNVFQLFPVQLQPVIQTAPEPVPDPIPVTPSAPPPAHSEPVAGGGSSHQPRPLIISMTSSVAVSVRNSSRKLAREMKSVLVPGAEVTAIAEDLSNLNLHHRVSRDGFQLEVTPDKYPVTRPCVVLVDGGPKARESDIA